jgi:hypothetical protein
MSKVIMTSFGLGLVLVHWTLNQRLLINLVRWKQAIFLSSNMHHYGPVPCASAGQYISRMASLCCLRAYFSLNLKYHFCTGNVVAVEPYSTIYHNNNALYIGLYIILLTVIYLRRNLPPEGPYKKKSMFLWICMTNLGQIHKNTDFRLPGNPFEF